jgi:hypothetical protein
MAVKLTKHSKNSDITASSGRELYHLQFSLQAASPETLGLPSYIIRNVQLRDQLLCERLPNITDFLYKKSVTHNHEMLLHQSIRNF